MNASTVISSFNEYQSLLSVLTLLELNGYLYPPPALLSDGDVLDYVIVGGGTAGCVLATRLAQEKYNVLLIEAGPDAPFEAINPKLVPYLKNSHVDWNYTTENDNYNYQGHAAKHVDLTQGKMLGGTGALNYMIYSRGHSQNYEDWYHITKDPTWKWENVLPYFIKAEAMYDSAIMNSSRKDCYGSEGYIGITRDDNTLTDDFLIGFNQTGKDLIDDIDGNKIGYSRALLTIHDGMRQDSGSRYLRQVVDNPYLAVAKNTLATKIIFDDNKNAVGVEVISDEHKKIIIKARQEIIITAGAIKTPQLLMLSGVGPCKDLKKFNISCVCNMPVGRNLFDHIAAFIPHKTNKEMVMENKDISKYPAGLFVGYASLDECHTIYHRKIPNYQALGYIINDVDFLLEYCVSTFGFPIETCNKLYHEANGNQLLITLLNNEYMHTQGQVLLRSRNPKDPPKVITPGFSCDRDLDDFVEYIKDYLKVEQSEAFKNLGATMIDLTKCDAFKKESKEYWRCYILCLMVSLRSYAGTCAMGSVVDSKLRVYGVNKLRVADASIMPTHMTGNIYLPVIMIAEKAAHFIIKDAGTYNDVEHDIVKLNQIRNMPTNLG